MITTEPIDDENDNDHYDDVPGNVGMTSDIEIIDGGIY